MLRSFSERFFLDEGAARRSAASKCIAGKSIAAPFNHRYAQSSASF
jgi:hypothetical protein